METITMKINEVIRKYRKELNLTQEQIANYLGVTAPAVNKWENGISYPDITLLAPLARILKIDIDTLLSFKGELADNEINQLIQNISDSIQNDGYEQGFEKGDMLIKEYPNCDLLILYVAQILNAFISIQGIENPEIYEAKITSWYELVVTSKREEVATMATAALVSYYMNKKEYEKAQQLLDKIPSLGYDKRLVQAMLFTNQEKNAEAYEIYENMILKSTNEISSVLQIMIRLLCKEKKYEKAVKYAHIGKTLAELFDMGSYAECTPQLFLALDKKDKEKSIEMLEQMIRGVETMADYQKSQLYTHIKFNETSNLGNLKKMLSRALESDEELDFIKNEPRFKRLFKMLEE